MLYQALYRKYRPKTFEEVSGQKIVVQTLKNAIKNNKLTHAYLFIGPRGTGKTSIAKIFAKTINCENPIDGISCEKCSICNLSNNNENVDIIEMDAASNNGVDEIREIKNHVSLMPTFSKYKIYIIDEVHMLSMGAFNALLKTLEEPPKHVIFILATTEPQKVPLTILSRCQCFEFKSIPKNLMSDKIKDICKNENILIDDSAIDEICNCSNGGLRDAIGLLDQLNSFKDETITVEDVLLLNGRIDNKQIEDFFEKIYQNNLNDTIILSDKFEEDGKDYNYICEDMIKYLKNELINFQINNESNIISKFGKDNIINIIFKITEYNNMMKNIKDKKIYFDLMIIELFNYNNTKINSTNNIAINNDTNVRINKQEDFIKNDINKEVKEVKIEKELAKETEKIKTEKYVNYKKLMDIRLNNILALADRESLKEYLEFFTNLEASLENLEQRKIYNLLLDCTIKAGSKDGIIITASNDNILFELFDNFEDIQTLFTDKLLKPIRVCFYKEDLWNEKRQEYIIRIKNKEKIDILDEKSIIDIIKNNEESNKSEFDDLLEIGE